MPKRYTFTAILLHWLSALLILAAASLALYMTGLQLSPTKAKLFSWHKWVGVTIFLLAMIRVLWRLAHRAPTLPDTMPAWQRTVAAATHGLLYLLVIAIPLSGWLMSSAFGFQTVYLGLAPLPDLLAKNKVLAEQLRSVHQALNWALLVVAVVHVAAALKHYLVDRDDVLSRMLPILKPRA